MGAETFIQESTGKNAQEAFRNAVRQAEWDYGHNRYTGSIAEKDSFCMISLPKDKDAYDYANELINNGDSRIDDKWGPAGCFKLMDGRYMFFGWASS